MDIIIKEIKAKCAFPEKIEHILKDQGAEYIGLDHQVDTYFNVQFGRLKLRQGSIESNLIQYDRAEVKDIKESHVQLFKTSGNAGELKSILAASCGIKAVVNKRRKIFFINNVKFHIDEVENLGHFIEIEAIGEQGKSDGVALFNQCKKYMKLLNVKESHLIDKSYSDLIIEKSH